MKLPHGCTPDHDDRTLCGWRVRSALHLPELLPWAGDDRPVDLEIACGPVTEPAAAPCFTLPHSQVWADGVYLLSMEGVGRFRVEAGRRVLVEPAPGATGLDLRVFLLGTVLGVLCHQRGLLPVHASAVAMGGRAVLFAGASGQGQSSLAAALGQRGHALVADDVVAITPGRPMALPAYPQRKLAVDVMEILAMDATGLEPERPGRPKFRIPALAGFAPAPLAPLCLYLLQGTEAGQPAEIQPQEPAAALAWLSTVIFRRRVGMQLQGPQALSRAIACLAQAAPVHLLTLPRGLPLAGLGSLAERVEAHAQDLARR